MNTNLYVAVTVALVTNVAEIFPMINVPAPNEGQPGDLVYYSKNIPVKDPKEKWVTTSIVEEHRYSFHDGPLEFRLTNAIAVTNWTVHYILVPPPAPEWKASTNQPPIPMYWPPQMFIGR